MLNKKRVSVIIPTFNSGRYITEAIDSVLKQTYRNIEIIIIDDGSTDNTTALLAPYIQQRAIRYFHQNNAGLSAARNTGVSLAVGEYIALLDADDMWKTDKLYIQVEVLSSKKDTGMVFTDFGTFDSKGTVAVSKNHVKFRDGELVTFDKLFANNNFIYPSTVLIKKDVFEACGLFDQGLSAVEDYDMWLRIAKKIAISGINNPLTLIRLHEKNMSKDITRMLESELKVIEKHICSVVTPVYLRRKAKAFMLNADRYIQQSKHRAALKLFFRGLVTYPLLFSDMLIVFVKFMLGVNLIEKLRMSVYSKKWLSKIYLYLYKRY